MIGYGSWRKGYWSLYFFVLGLWFVFNGNFRIVEPKTMNQKPKTLPLFLFSCLIEKTEFIHEQRDKN